MHTRPFRIEVARKKKKNANKYIIRNNVFKYTTVYQLFTWDLTNFGHQSQTDAIVYFMCKDDSVDLSTHVQDSLLRIFRFS